jgi:hypothetical protein
MNEVVEVVNGFLDIPEGAWVRELLPQALQDLRAQLIRHRLHTLVLHLHVFEEGGAGSERDFGRDFGREDPRVGMIVVVMVLCDPK